MKKSSFINTSLYKWKKEIGLAKYKRTSFRLKA
jgi:hypothetical protein